MVSQPDTHPDSYYVATAIDMPTFDRLTEDVRADVCVVGGGYTGLSSALNLAERGYDVVLLEGRRVGWGASGRNGGQIGSGQRRDPEELEKEIGKAHTRALWDIFEEAKQIIRDRVERHNIPCDLTVGKMAVANKQQQVPEYKEHVELLQNNYGVKGIRFVDREEVCDMVGSTAFHGGFVDNESGHLHPLNYALGLARAARDAGVRIYEKTMVQSYNNITPSRIRTPSGSVTADFIVLGCNGYLCGLEPRVAGKIMPINNYILATEPLGEGGARALIRDNVCLHDSKFVVNYWRTSADHRLIFGGGESYTSQFPANLKSYVRKYMLRIYPQLQDTRIDYAWGGTLGVTMTRMPHFGRLQPNVYFAHGFSGHGIAMAGLAGKLISECIAGQAERFDLFATVKARTFPGGTLLRWPSMVAGMLYYSLRDKL